jgi:hypothetical protein
VSKKNCFLRFKNLTLKIEKKYILFLFYYFNKIADK